MKLIRILPQSIRQTLEQHPEIAKVIANIRWLFADKVLRIGIGAVVGVWLARYLGPDRFGQLSYAMAFVALFGAVSGLGLNGIVVRDLVRDPEGAAVTLGTAFSLQVLGGLAAIALCVGSAPWLRYDDPLVVQMITVASLVYLCKAPDVVRYWFESQVRSRYVVVLENVTSVTFVLARGLLILGMAPVLAFVWVGVLEAMILGCGLLVIYSLWGGRLLGWRFCPRRAQVLMAHSWPLILSNLAIAIYLRIDQIMLGQMLGNDALGVYSAAVQLSEVWYFLPMAIVASAAPSIINARARSMDEYNDGMMMLYRVLLVLCLLVAITMTFLSTIVVTALYGSAFEEAGLVLSILVWAGVPVALGVASSQPLLIENLQRYSFYRTIIGGLLNILLNFALIPRFGIAGAAVATLISYFAATFSLILFPNCRAIAISMLRVLLLDWRRR